MRPGRFFWKVFLGNAVLLVIMLGVAVWLIVAEYDRFYAEQASPYLHSYAETVVKLIENRLTPPDPPRIESLITQASWTHPHAVRITVIAPDGRVLADTQGDASKMENHADRAEVQQALAAGRGESVRLSDTVSKTMKYVAVRMTDSDGSLAGVVRVAMPLPTLTERYDSMFRLMGPIGLASLVSGIALAVGLALLWSSRIRRITSAAKAIARGDLHSSVEATGRDEVATLGRSLEHMRGRLAEQVATITSQRRTLESLVGNLSEGVVVADAEGWVVLINPAAGRMLNFAGPSSGEMLSGSQYRVEQVIFHHDLQRLIVSGEAPSSSQHTDSTEATAGAETFLYPAIRLDIPNPKTPTYVLAHAADISLGAQPGFKGKGMGTPGRLLVLADVTALVRAIRSRSDFVANASHELRTPVAAIRTAVETLGQMNLATETDSAQRFIDIIQRHSSRLEALVQDLLALANLESPAARFDPVTLFVRRVVDELQTRWDDALRKKGLQWNDELSPQVSQVKVSGQLLSMVLDNLVDNSIKFTPAGGRITVRVMDCGPDVCFQVEDTGCGIALAEQERVFERFYQVDAARAGSVGQNRGTGLGLSIVRHAASAMGGAVTLESELFKGTKVTLTIPREPRHRVTII